MEQKMMHLTRADYVVSRWSGGTTTQLAITPEEAVYADRNFLWRISSATVELDESEFTALPDYNRLISTLKGEIEIAHNGGERLRLSPCSVHAFDGGDATRSWGRCTDFNLMMRKGKCEGSMDSRRLAGGDETLISINADTVLIYCAEGSACVTCGTDSVCTAAGEAVLIRGQSGAFAIKAVDDGVFMIVQVREI